MKNFFVIAIFVLFLTNYSFAKTGQGELKLSTYTMESLMMYFYGASNPKYSDGADKKNKPMLMTISADGKYSHYYYCPYIQCETGPYVYKSIKRCEKNSKGSPCYLFAKGRFIKWKNSKNARSTKVSKKLLKEPYQIAKLIQDLGFYDGDISELPGIDYKTGQLDEEKKITGKKDNYDYPSLIASLSPSHKTSWKDYVEGGSEKYKAWVMVKRKDKDFSWGFEADNTSWNDVIKKAFNRCNNYIKQKPKSFPDKAMCILYYKGTTPTTDDEKIKTARIYYGESRANAFFEKYPYVLDKKINTEKENQNKQSSDIVSKIKELKKLLDEGVITQEEFDLGKKKLLN